MNTQEPLGPTTPQAAVRTLQIIVLALALGAAFFVGASLFITKLGFAGAPDFLCYLGLGFGLVVFALHLVVPRIVENGAVAKINSSQLDGLSDDEKFSRLFPHRLTATIVACALLEGGAYLNITAYLLTSWVWSLVAGVVLIIFVITHFPTQSSSEFWAEDRAREIESNR